MTRLNTVLLESLRERWIQADAAIVSYLRPGLSDEDIDALTSPLGISLPEEARVWWRWHDGADDDPGRGFYGDFGPAHAYAPLKKCVDLCLRTRERMGYDPSNESSYVWVPQSLPFTSFETWTLIDAGVGSDETVPVRGYLAQEGGPRPKGTDSIGALIELYLDAMDRGVWVPDGSGGWDWDEARITAEDEELMLVAW